MDEESTSFMGWSIKESLLISNKPYKLIYLSTGNITNKMLLEIFSKNIEQIVELVSRNRLIEITNDSIVLKG
jgi:predicted nuclease of predicted toxin-antitoxin system